MSLLSVSAVRLFLLTAACITLSFLAGCSHRNSAAATPAKTLAQIVREAQAQNPIPGLAAAYVTSLRVEIAVAGVRKSGTADMVQAEDQFHLGSNIKAMTSMVAASLVESELIGWDSRVIDVLPELAAEILPTYQVVTLEDLLRHRAGVMALDDAAALALVPELSGAVSQQRAAFSRWALQQSPAATPGKDFLYSNAGYVVASAMLERVSGQAYEQLLQERVLKPLGLKGKFGWPADGDSSQPWGHEVINGNPVAADPTAAQNQFPAWLTPAGNLSMSVADYARFAQIHLLALRGQPALLGMESYIKMHTTADGYALGWAPAVVNGVPCNAHLGASGLFSAVIIVEPAGDKAVVVLANADGETVEDAVWQLAQEIHANIK